MNPKILFATSFIVLLICLSLAEAGKNRNKQKTKNSGNNTNANKGGASNTVGTSTKAGGGANGAHAKAKSVQHNVTTTTKTNNAHANAANNGNGAHANAAGKQKAATKNTAPAAHPSATGKSADKAVDQNKVATGLAKLAKPKASVKVIESAKVVGGRRVPNARKSPQMKANQLAAQIAKMQHGSPHQVSPAQNGRGHPANKPMASVQRWAKPKQPGHAIPTAPKSAEKQKMGSPMQRKDIAFAPRRSLSAPTMDAHHQLHEEHHQSVHGRQRAHSHNGVVSNHFPSSLPQQNLSSGPKQSGKKQSEPAKSPSLSPHSSFSSPIVYGENENLHPKEERVVQPAGRKASTSYEVNNGEPAFHETSTEEYAWKNDDGMAPPPMMETHPEMAKEEEMFNKEKAMKMESSENSVPKNVFETPKKSVPLEVFDKPSETMTKHAFDDDKTDDIVPKNDVFDAELKKEVPSDGFDDVGVKMSDAPIAEEQPLLQQQNQRNINENDDDYQEQKLPLESYMRWDPRTLGQFKIWRDKYPIGPCINNLCPDGHKCIVDECFNSSICGGQTPPKLMCTMDNSEFQYFRSHSGEVHAANIADTAAKCTHLAIENGTLEVVMHQNGDNDEEEEDDEGGVNEAVNAGGEVQFRTKPLGNAVTKLKSDANNLLLSTVNFSSISRTDVFTKQMNEAGQHVVFNLRGTIKIAPKDTQKGPPSRLDLIKSILEQSKSSLFDGFMLDFTEVDLSRSYFADFIMDFALKLHSERANKIQKSPSGRDVQRRVFAIRLDGTALAFLKNKSGTFANGFVKNLKYADIVVVKEGQKGEVLFEAAEWLLEKGVDCQKIVDALPTNKGNNQCNNNTNNNNWQRRKRTVMPSVFEKDEDRRRRRKRTVQLKELSDDGEELEQSNEVGEKENGKKREQRIVSYQQLLAPAKSEIMFENELETEKERATEEEKQIQGEGQPALMWHKGYHQNKGELQQHDDGARALLMPPISKNNIGGIGQPISIPKTLLLRGTDDVEKQHKNGKQTIGDGEATNLLKWDEEWHAKEDGEKANTDEANDGANGERVEIDIDEAVISYAASIIGGVEMPLFVRQLEQNCKAEANANILFAHKQNTFMKQK